MKSGFVAVAGRPNVGKSTLVNALCGGKVAIVSDKPQTTRRRIAAVVNGDGFQLVLTDLPGFQRPRDALTERMQRTVDASRSIFPCSISLRATARVTPPAVSAQMPSVSASRAMASTIASSSTSSHQPPVSRIS